MKMKYRCETSKLEIALGALAQDHALGVAVINLFQRLVGQEQAVDPPATLAGRLLRTVAEILVVGFQKAVVQLVGRQAGAGIDPEQNAVGVAQEEAPRSVRLAAQLGQARA